MATSTTSTPAEGAFLFDGWFDPIEAGLRTRVRGFIETLLEEELTAGLSRPRGWTTKILAMTDALGNLVRFVLLPGQRYDTIGVAPLIDGVDFDMLIADKAFDVNGIIKEANERRHNRHLPTPQPQGTSCYRRGAL